MVLNPKVPMTENEKLWWALCITANRFRFGFGRQANRTLKHLDLPDPQEIPSWVAGVDFAPSFTAILKGLKASSGSPRKNATGSIGPKKCQISDLFEVQYGTNLELLRLNKSIDGVNFVSRTAKNNGVAARVEPLPDLMPTAGGALPVAAGGSVLETYVQFEPFYSGRDLYVLRPKVPFLAEELMFYSACIRANQWRYSYGRQANRTLRTLKVPTRDSIPYWVYGSFGRIAGGLLKSFA
jgi:hypothetical protein